jgi:hypothetical protein
MGIERRAVDKRKNLRRSVQQPAIVVSDDGSILGKCLMLDVSATGAKLKLAAGGVAPPRFILVLSRDGQLRRQCSIVWQSGETLGVRFQAD